MASIKKLFVVVDPSDARHVALERALIMGQRSKMPPELFVFVGVDGEAADLRASNDALFRDQDWFDEEIRKPIEEAGMKYTMQVSWSQEWQQSIVMSANRFGAERIYLPVHERVSHSRFSFSEAKWELLKTANCPVLLVQPGARPERKTILAAVNFQATRPEQQELNKSILYWARSVAEIYGAELHLVNGYKDSMNYPDRGKLARDSELANDHIHMEQGYSSEVVSSVANRLNADLVVMGTLGQTGKARTRRGNTADRIIASLTQDVMVVNH
ncbi:universal stress protein [Proteobacteria bacterium 005FR1]|nr:universal stress protein [Proteobacteria bacterium 005FR1]